MDPRRIYMELVALDKQLRDLLRANPSNAQDANALRRRLMDAAARLADAHPTFAASKEVEQALWKPCFYRRIEDFRQRIRKYAAAQADHNVREHFARVSSEFQQFLTESAAFYARLRDVFASWLHCNQGQGDSDAITCCRQSLHRCYVFLGDLARYRELHSQKAKKNFAPAEALYYRALAVLPENGNPHNQLAVLATYVEAETVAVYRYCRSLLTSQPFSTAGENLALLFERSRQRPLAAPIVLTSSSPSSKEKSAFLKSFLHRLTRMHGILFAQSSPHDASSASTEKRSHEGALMYPRDMEALLLKDIRTLLQTGIMGDALLLKLFVTNIFCIIRASESRSQASPVEDALCLSIRLVTSVLKFFVDSLDMKLNEKTVQDSAVSMFRLAGPVGVFCDYLELHPDMLELLEQLLVHRQKKLFSDVATSEQGTSADQFALEFFDTLAKLVNHARTRELFAPLILGAGAHSGDGIGARQDLLKESIELRGFAPLEQKGTKATWQDDWALQTASTTGVNGASLSTPLPDLEAAQIRAWKLYRFARYLCDGYEGNPLLFCDASGHFTTSPVVGKANTQHNIPEVFAPLNLGFLSAENTKQQQQSVDVFGNDSRAGTGLDDDDDFEDEVIVYQPSPIQKEVSENQYAKQYGGFTSNVSPLETFSGGGAFSVRASSPVSPAKSQGNAMFDQKRAFGAGNSLFGASLSYSGFNGGGSISSQHLGWGESGGNTGMLGNSFFGQELSMSFGDSSGQNKNFSMPLSTFGDVNGAKCLYSSSDKDRFFAPMADLAAVERESALYQQKASSLSAFLGTPAPLTQIETQDPSPPRMPTRPPPGFGTASISTQHQEHHTPNP